jgi:hypothetical protein
MHLSDGCMGGGGLLPQPEYKANYSSPSNTEDMNAESLHAVSLYTLMEWCIDKQMSLSFTFVHLNRENKVMQYVIDSIR